MRFVFSFSKYEKFLLAVFILTLPLVNPWVRGDGVGYYAYARSLLIEHRLDFTKDWLHANDSFRIPRTDGTQVIPKQYTSTGHLDNHFSIGPAMLWLPFLFMTHIAVRIFDALGAHVAADGYSRPYILAMGAATAIYGFLTLWISFLLARKYVSERWAFLATTGVWFASSLPVYMYFNPSWSHAHSAFAVALFLYYWNSTRKDRTWRQWAALGALGGLMLDVYYVNVTILLLPAFDTLESWLTPSDNRGPAITRMLVKVAVFLAATFVVFLPTLITKKIIYGSFLNFGYGEHWRWTSPALGKVLFSADHGLFSWTPILILSAVGLFLFPKQNRVLGLILAAILFVNVYLIGCYQNWDGISSFGNRFFVSLTSVFVLGLAIFFHALAERWSAPSALALARTVTAVLVMWNMGLVFQWGSHLIPARGPISWRTAVYNQFAVVPFDVARTMDTYFTHRQKLMETLEQQDVKRVRSRQSR